MTKKLFVVLVVVLAMVVAVSWAIAAKKAVKGDPQRVEMPKFMDQQSPNAMPKAVAGLEKQDAISIKATKQSAAYTAAGPLAGQFNRPGGKDFCDLYGSAAYAITDWFYGQEWYANYQDPEEFGCAAVWPFQVVDVGFNIIVDYAQDIVVQGFVYSADWTDPECPVPFQEVCATPEYTFSLPDAGHWALGMPLTEECCVYEPYFAVIYIVTDLYGTGADAVSDDVPIVCRSYNDYGAGWEDLVVNYGWPGCMMLWSDGYTSPQNECPTEGDTCGVSSVTPDIIELLAGGTAEFTANVYFQGNQTECYLTVTPDPACPSCVTTITPNPVVDPQTSATVTIVTDPSTPSGDYVFDVNGSKASATLRVLEPSTECELSRDNDAWSGYFSGYRIGDQNAMLMDPEAMCIGCGPDVYPFKVEYVKVKMYDHAGVGGVDVIFHLYEAPEPYCDGPGAEIYQFPATVTTFYPEDWVTYDLPEPICVDGPFWLALEYNSGTEGQIPCLLMDNQDYDDTCTQFNWRYYDETGWIWREWADFWVPPPPGYLSLRGGGNCNSPCPQECYLIQDPGEVAYYFGSFAAGDLISKYFDPELYCEEPVYPLNIHDVDLLLYDPWGTGTVDIRVNIHMVCHDTCDGPGTHIYRSDPFTITTFYPDMAHIDLEDVVCVNEPFFISLEYATGVQGATPSPMWPSEDYPCDSCHVWMYWASGGYPFWIEWNDFWAPPAGGCPIIRVSAATNHPDCLQDPCEDPLEMLWGGLYAYYYWKQPPNGEFINMMFTTPLTNPMRLDAVEVAWYAGGTQGTPDPDVYVWLSDGSFPLDNNPPYQAIAEFHVANEDLVFYPSYYYIQTHELGLMFDPGEKFHVGGSHAHEPDDTLAWLTDDGAFESERGSEWDGSAWSSFYPYEFLINAYGCLFEPPESTFTLECSPFLANVTPGDPPAVKFNVDVGSILGYDLNVALSCAEPAGFHVSFDPPNGNPPFASDVYVSVDAGTPYDDYTLTFCGTGDDAQVVCCDVKARVQPPFDDNTVDFYHGKQRMTNFGALADMNKNDNFLWYGITALLFDGSFIVASGPDEQALDFGYSHEHHGFVPPAHQTVTYDPSWPANIGFAEFYTDPDIIVSFNEHDSLYVIGIMDSCVGFSIKIKTYHNPGPDWVDPVYIAVFEDWDFGDAYNNWGDLDYDHNLVWMYEPLDSVIICGLFKAPYYDEPMRNVQLIHNAYITWPNEGYGLDPDSVWRLLTFEGTQPATYVGPDSQDYSVMITPQPLTLAAGERHIEVWIDFCRNLAVDEMSWSQWWHRVLRYAGFYRGDVNASDSLELPQLDVSDLVYLIQYLFMDGPTPLPYADQGDVDGTCCGFTPDEVYCGSCVNIGDVIYLLNYVFLSGPPPIDYVRFVPGCWPRESLFENPNWD